MSARQFAHNASSPGVGSIARARNPRPAARSRVDRPGRFASTLTARDLMNASVVTARPEYSVERAAQLISATECGALPVVDGSMRLIGIITNRDITARLVARGSVIKHAQVSDCMTTEAFACSGDASIETCMRAMSWHQVKHIPIVDEDHKVIGMICKSDLTRYLCEHTTKSGQVALADLAWALA